MKLRLLVSALVALFAFSASATQYNPVLPTSSPYPGLTMLGNINSAYQALLTNSSGSSAPSYAAADMLWADTSNSLLKFYDGSNWLPFGKFSGSQWVAVSNGIPLTCPTSGGSANAYTVTYSPAATAYATGQTYCFNTNFAITGAATVNVNGLGAKALTKRGATALASGDLGSGVEVICVYDGTQCQVVSQLSQSSGGTVTSVGTSGAITGGPITGSGTITMTSQGNNTIISNISGGSAAPTGNSLTAIMDSVTTGVQGEIYYRNATGVAALAPGTNGQILITQGPSANPTLTNTLANGTVATTQASSDNSTKVATTAFVQTAVGTPSLPSALGIGSYVMATTAFNCTVGGTVNGSDLTTYGFATNGSAPNTTANSLSGTWRCMQTQGNNQIVLYLRIT